MSIATAKPLTGEQIRKLRTKLPDVTVVRGGIQYVGVIRGFANRFATVSIFVAGDWVLNYVGVGWLRHGAVFNGRHFRPFAISECFTMFPN